MFEAADLEHKVDKAAFKREEARLRAALLDAQYDLSRDARFPVLIVIGGVEGAGKGETVNLLHEWMDPRHLLTTAFGPAGPEELERPPMWRFWRALPPRGKVADVQDEDLLTHAHIALPLVVAGGQRLTEAAAVVGRRSRPRASRRVGRSRSRRKCPATKWTTVRQANLLTYCQGDGDSPTPIGLDWGAKGKNAIASASYTFYRGDYLNYLASSGAGDKYRIDVIREVVAEVLANTRGIKAGLMRYGYDGDRVFRQNTATACEVEPNPIEGSRSSNGAPILFPVTDLDSDTPLPGLPLSKDEKTGESAVLSQLRYQLGVDKQDEGCGGPGSYAAGQTLPGADLRGQPLWRRSPVLGA